MQELTEAGDKSGGNKPKCELEDRRYIIANFFLFLFLVVVMILVLVITGLEWPIKRKGRITVDNKTGKACYVTLLSKDTDNYGTFGKRLRIVGSEEYWDAVKDVYISRGMTEEEAGQYAEEKKAELRIEDGTNASEQAYSFEMYRELMDAYSERMSSHAPGMSGAIVYHGFFEGDKTLYPPYEVWKEIASYQDRDGYLYIHQEARLIHSSERVINLEEWGFPEQFKILLYWPEEGRYAVSDVWTTDHILSEYRVTADKLPDETVAGLAVVEQSKSERVPWWIVMVALIVFVGSELLIARLCGARHKRQLTIIAVTSTALHAALFAILLLTQRALMVDGALTCNLFLLCIAKWVIFPVIEIPIYVKLLREKGKYSFLWYKYCDFTLFINWASSLLIILVLVGVHTIQTVCGGTL